MTNTDRSAARLIKTGIAENLAKHLAGKGILSALQLANMPVAQLQELLGDVNLGIDTVYTIRKRATVMKALINNHLVTVRGQVSPSYKALASTNANNNIINFHEGMESYPEMFGNLEYATDPEFDSMISPAAYLVDLMRYINEYIEQPPNEDDKALLLQSRRPDIWKIPLDMENTVQEIPYLQLVNEILQTKLDAAGRIDADGSINEKEPIGNALQYMAETIFPFNLPFNTPLEKIRKYLQALQTTLYEIYTTFNIDPEAQTREYLTLSAEQTAYLTTPLVNKDSLNLAYGNINSNNPKSHFTGIENDANLGSLTDAEVFMNQVGFSQTRQLEALFYQNINRDLPGSNELLNSLFINKSANQQYLIYSPTETTGPNWANEGEWEDASCYSTLQRVVVGGELYILVRTKKGIDTWQYNSSHRNWVQITSATPAWSDETGWNQEKYYSTIQAVAAIRENPLDNNKLYLFGRYIDGMHTLVFDTIDNTWTEVFNIFEWPDWGDKNGWDKPEYYRTIKTVTIGAKIFLLGRQPDGIHTWCLNTTSNTWTLIPPFDSMIPDFTDVRGYTDPSYYLTIQAIAYEEQLFLIGRSKYGIETYTLFYIEKEVAIWLYAEFSYPAWGDYTPWQQPASYCTIQLFKVNGELFLLGSGPDGIELYWLELIEPFLFQWIYIPNSDAVPNWLVADWKDPSHYLTIRAFALGKNIGLLARSATGIQTWEMSFANFQWKQLETNVPAWSGAAGWNTPSYYTSIHPVLVNQSLLLLGCTKTAIDAWRFDAINKTWVKEILVKAVIELENRSRVTRLNMAVLDRLNRFIRLADSIGWSYEDLDWAFIAAGADDITTDSISAIKNLQWIMDRLHLTAWQATAFSHDLKTYGEGNGPVSQAPFDLVFNQPMPFIKKNLININDPAAQLYHPQYQFNPNYQDEPVIWQTDDKSAGGYTVLFRLMAALQLDAGNVKALVNYLKGFGLYNNANEMELGVENLSVLYRYALLANTLNLSIPELIILLEFLDINKPLCFSRDAIIRIVTCNQWIVENKLTVYKLNYSCNAIGSKWVDTGFDLLKVPDLLKSLSEAATEWYVNAKQLQLEDLMSVPISHSFYNTLAYKKYLDDRGIILKNGFSFSAVSDCFVCERLTFADLNELTPVCKVGSTGFNDTPSQIVIPANPDNGFPVQIARDGAVSLWFKYDSAQTGKCTLFSLYNKKQQTNVTTVYIEHGCIVLAIQNLLPLIVYKIPTRIPIGDQWHFLVISYKEQLLSLDQLPTVTNLLELQIPPEITGTVTLGAITDSFTTRIAELRLFDASVAAAVILQEFFPFTRQPTETVKGNRNYWPLNEGQGAETAKDIAGDLNGAYAGKTVWNIVYNTVIPERFSYLNTNGSLTPVFDPANNDPANKPFIVLWKTIVTLRNILNKTISIQKQGTLQQLSNYYQVNKDLAVYADYMADKEVFPHYVQTLLAYRFSLSWLEFSLGLDQQIPYISSYLMAQFAANKLPIAENAVITRLTDADGFPVDKWLIHESADEVFYLGKREEALDIYKLLPVEAPAIYLVDDSFPADDKYCHYNKYHIDQKFNQHTPTLYFSDCDGQMASLMKKGNYVRVVIYEIPGTKNDVVAQINDFIADLGQLLFTVKTLQLSDAEFKCIIDNKNRFFGAADRTAGGLFSLARIEAILLFKKLNNVYTEKDRSFADYFYLADDMGSLVNYIAELTHWDAQGLKQLSQWNCPYEQFAAIDIQGVPDPSERSVAADSDYAMVGYALSNTVFIYQLKGEKWEALPQILSPKGAVSFGAAVAIQNYYDGNTIKLRAIIADTAINNGAGVVYLYEYNRENKEWNTPILLTAPDATARAAFGSSLAIYGNTIAIGAPNAGSNKAGEVYIFEYVSRHWTYQPINFTTQPTDSLLGNSISLYDEIITIGAKNNAYIFRLANSMAVPVVPPVSISTAEVVNNGDFVVMSAMSSTEPVINYIMGVRSSNPSPVRLLMHADFSGVCTIAIADDTLVVNDSNNTCFVYYIQNETLSYRNSFRLPVSISSIPVQPWPIALGNGNLIAGGANGNIPVMLFYGTRHNIHWFGFADDCFKLANKLGVSIGSLLEFISLSKLKMQVRSSTDDPGLLPDHNERIYASYENYAHKLASALALGRTIDEWDAVYTPLRNKFLERQRDALAEYMIFSLRNAFTDITNRNDLYELLLIDVGSSGCRSISTIKAALNSLQLYIERCRMQLEPYASIKTSVNEEGDELNAADVEWSWMSHYRIWEANRQVYLFPEKYLDPTLRKDKTNAYADLEDKLSQSNVTNDNAIEAFESYFQNLETLTGLTVVSCCMGRIASFVNGIVVIKNTFFIFAKTKNRNEGYYYRTAEGVLPSDTPEAWINWTNWKQINISIKADSAACVYANGRPYLFWLQFTKQQVTGNGQTYSSEKSFYYETKAYYSFQHSNGQWANPHEVPDTENKLNFSVTPNDGTPVQVTLPAKPDLNTSTNAASLSISFIVTNGAATPASPLSIPIDDILNSYEGHIDSASITSPDNNVVILNAIQNVNGKIIQQLNKDLFKGGADYLYKKNSLNITSADLSSKAPYGRYMWELFYHIPMLIGQLLSSNNQFEDAKHWYEYIFKPTAPDKSKDRFWQLGYFRGLGKPEDIVEILTGHTQDDMDQLLIYDLDPFDPEAIAYLRPGAFEKKTVVNYIKNLIDWGDSLFSQYTWETITQAEMLYVLAKELLGKRPAIAGAFTKRIPMTIAQVEDEYQNDIPQFVIDIEDMQPSIHAQVQYTPALSAAISNFYFGIPENDELPAYQDLVDTRLFEIRNCLNILGQQQSLALFEPPVNPMMLVGEGAAGLNLANVPIGYATDIPYFRFRSMIAYAKAVSERVVDFGRQILTAIEKSDEELLVMLRILQEKTILDLTTSIKEKNIEEAMNQALVLDQSLANANERVAYYTRMLAKPVSDLEGKALSFNQTAIDIEIPATELHVAAVIGHLIPTVFGFADGDFSPGGSIESAATALSTGSSIANNLANMTAVSASYTRRTEDWDLQLKLAQYEATSIGIQKAINDIYVQNARTELAVQQQNITNNNGLQQFYTNKFTNRQLYQWMINQISSVYYQAFQQAQDLAKKAQAAYQFELNTNENIITYGYWDNTRRGLLSGEKLLADLGRLEKAYVDNNQRYLEIQKIVSLKEVSITEFDRLIKTGTCRINLTEQLYDWDFPGHYNRKIKSVSITIPAIVGPYQTIKASLLQQSNKVITKPDLNTVKYLVSKEKVPPQVNNSLRINWRPNQQIVISKASGDSGMFELNFNDDRYLPFEGTGAVSEWQLSIPAATNTFDLTTISDVIMYINYTAQDGGVEFAQQVINLPEIKNYKGILVVSIKQQFNQSWNKFMANGSATFSVQCLQFPANLQLPVHIDEDKVVMLYSTLNSNSDGIKVVLTFNEPGPYDWQISFDNSKRAELLDIILEIPYNADLK